LKIISRYVTLSWALWAEEWLCLTVSLWMAFSWELFSSVQNASMNVSYKIMSPLPHKEEGMTNNSPEQQRRSKMQKLYAGIDISKDTHHV